MKTMGLQAVEVPSVAIQPAIMVKAVPVVPQIVATVLYLVGMGSVVDLKRAIPAPQIAGFVLYWANNRGGKPKADRCMRKRRFNPLFWIVSVWHQTALLN